MMVSPMASLRALLLLRRVQHAVLDTIVQGRAGGIRQEGSHGRLAALEVLTTPARVGFAPITNASRPRVCAHIPPQC